MESSSPMSSIAETSNLAAGMAYALPGRAPRLSDARLWHLPPGVRQRARQRHTPERVRQSGLCAGDTNGERYWRCAGGGWGGGGGGGGGGSSTTTTYVGAIASPVALGSFTAAITTTAGSSALASDRAVETRQASSPVRIRSGASASITITLVSGATLTLTGSVSGTLFTVSDGNGDSCSGNVAKILTANCTIAGFPVTITGVVVVGSALAGFTTYCGLESPVGASYGAGALLLDIAGSNAFVGRIAAVNDSGSLDIWTCQQLIVHDERRIRGRKHQHVHGRLHFDLRERDRE